MPEVTIRPDESDEVTIPRTVEGGQGWNWKWSREIGETWKLKINVDRASARDAGLEPKADAVELDGVTTGRLTDLEPDGSAWTLTVRSFEWDARREPPTSGGDLREGTDKELMQDLIAEVDGWTEGTVEELTGPLSFVFNHAHRHEAVRRIEQNVPGEFWVDGDRQAHYVENLGSDKSDSLTLSPDAQNVEGSLAVTNRGREWDATHVRVIGAHEGEAQRFATLVPSDDPNSYTNRVDYETDRWEPGDARDWSRWENKDVADQDTIEEEAEALGEELAESYVEVEAAVTGEDLSVGDWVHVEKPEADLDRALRVVRIETVQRGAAVYDRVTLATRTTTRDLEKRRLEDIQRFNVAFQGSSVAVKGGPVIAGVDDGYPLRIPFRYPDLEFENNAEVHVRGMEYRVDSDPEPHSHTIDIPFSDLNHDHPVPLEFTTPSATADADNVSPQDVTASSTGTFDRTVPYPFVSGDGSVGLVFATLSYHDEDATGWGSGALKISNISKSRTLHDDNTSQTYNQGEARHFLVADVGGVLDGDVLEWELDIGSIGSDGRFRLSYGAALLSDHEHDINDTTTSEEEFFSDTVETSEEEAGFEPGIFGTADTPSNVDLLIDGETVASDIGSGQFETVVDVSGEMTPGQWSMLEATSDSLGRLMVTVFVEGYDQIGAK